MRSNLQRKMIIEPWFRLLIGSDITIENISKIAAEFGNKYEVFDESLSHNDFQIESGILAFKKYGYEETQSVFGTMTAESGNNYHWKIKLKCDTDNIEDVNVGIIEDDKCEEYKTEYWWTKCGF